MGDIIAEVGQVTQMWQAICSILAVGVGLYTIRMHFRFRADVDLAQKLAATPGLLTAEYLERPLLKPKSTKTIRSWPANFKDARRLARKYYPLGESAADKVAREAFENKSTQEGNWENSFAADVSIALERIGILALSGAIPVRLVLDLVGHNVLEDWLYCREFVQKKVRNDRDVSARLPPFCGLPYFRRHGEWLAYLAALECKARWKGRTVSDLLDHYPERLDELLEKEKRLRSLDKHLPPASVRREIRWIRRLHRTNWSDFVDIVPFVGRQRRQRQSGARQYDELEFGIRVTFGERWR